MPKRYDPSDLMEASAGKIQTDEGNKSKQPLWLRHCWSTQQRQSRMWFIPFKNWAVNHYRNCIMNPFESVNMNFLDHRGDPGHLWCIQVCAGTGCSQATWGEQLCFSKPLSRVWSEHTLLNWSLLLTSSKHPLARMQLFFPKKT